MSLNHREIVSCPRCGAQKAFIVWDSINVNVDPNLKPMLIDGNLTTFRCEECGTESNVQFDCLYHDMDRGLAIWLRHEQSGAKGAIEPLAAEMFSTVAPDVMRRSCSSFHELLDKVRIFDDALSDVEIELIKLLICTRDGRDLASPFHYACTEGTWFAGENLVFVVDTDGELEDRRYPKKKSFNSIAQFMPRILPVVRQLSDGWPQVNRVFMLRALESTGLVREVRK